MKIRILQSLHSITATYIVVIFSIAVQGLTLGKFIRKCLGSNSLDAPLEETDAPAGGK